MRGVVLIFSLQMQEHGAPPAEIMGELPPGLDLGPDGAPQLPDGCLVV
jgi:peroxin-19